MRDTEKQMIRWTRVIVEEWNLIIAATERGVCFIGSQARPLQEVADWAARKYPQFELIEDPHGMQVYAQELAAYLQGERERFEAPFDLKGTPFQMTVWEALGRIPYGETFTYSEIASHIGKPAAVRAVGTAIGANPLLISVPCHRVIGKNGTLTGYRGGLAMKTRLLELERKHALRKGTPQHA